MPKEGEFSAIGGRADRAGPPTPRGGWPTGDACRCQACTASRVSTGVHRGPVQDESGKLDPFDALAMREVEGRPADDAEGEQ